MRLSSWNQPRRVSTRRRRTLRAPRRRHLPLWRRRTIKVGAALVVFGAVAQVNWYLWQSGWFADRSSDLSHAVVMLTRNGGFAVEHVLVEGRERTDRDTLLATLGVERGMPILAVDPTAARQRIEGLAWVDSASVARQLPDLVYVRIAEHRPLALWQHQGRLALINSRGQSIPVDVAGFGHLPLVVGEDAPDHAGTLLQLLAAYPSLNEQLEAAVRISGRRWNLRLQGSIEVRLPEGEVAVALTRLSELHHRKALLDRDVIAVDLRLPDRLIVQTNPAAETAKNSGENT